MTNDFSEGVGKCIFNHGPGYCGVAVKEKVMSEAIGALIRMNGGLKL